jgi:hypothetical protein
MWRLPDEQRELRARSALPGGVRLRLAQSLKPQEDQHTADSVYRVSEVIGVSDESWEAAARNAVETRPHHFEGQSV